MFMDVRPPRKGSWHLLSFACPVHRDTTHLSPLPENPPLRHRIPINGPSWPARRPRPALLEEDLGAGKLHCFSVLLLSLKLPKLLEEPPGLGPGWALLANYTLPPGRALGFHRSYQCFSDPFFAWWCGFFRGLPWCLPGFCSHL